MRESKGVTPSKTKERLGTGPSNPVLFQSNKLRRRLSADSLKFL